MYTTKFSSRDNRQIRSTIRIVLNLLLNLVACNNLLASLHSALNLQRAVHDGDSKMPPRAARYPGNEANTKFSTSTFVVHTVRTYYRAVVLLALL